MLSTAAKQRWEDVVTRRNTWVMAGDRRLMMAMIGVLG